MSKADPPMPDPTPSPSLSNPPPPYANSGLLPTIAAPPSGVGPIPPQAPIQTHYSPPPQPMPTTICPYCSMQLAYPHGAQLIICPGCRRTSQLTIVPRLQMNCTRCTTLLYYAPIYQLIQCPTCQLVIQPPHVTPIQTAPPPPFTHNPQLQSHQVPINPAPAPAPIPGPTPTISSKPVSSHPSQHNTPRPTAEGKERDEWDARHAGGGNEIEMKDMSGRVIGADEVSLEIEGSASKSSLVENLKKQQAKKKAQNGGYQPLLQDDD